MNEALAPEYHVLEIGDRAEVKEGLWGSVVSVDGQLLILWDDMEFSWADTFQQARKTTGNPYRIRRHTEEF